MGERRLSGLALAGVDVSAHVARIVRTAWELGAVDELAGLRRRLHMLGFRGHFATKSRRYSTTLGAIRRLARRLVELSQEEVATAAGVSRSMVALVEQGTCGIDVYRLRRMAAAVGLDLTELFDVPLGSR